MRAIHDLFKRASSSHSRSFNAAVILAAIASVSGCGGTQLSTAAKLNHLVVMGMVTSPASLQSPVAGPYNVALDPYISDINGTGSVSLRVESCLDPGMKDGLQQDCTNAQNKGPANTVIVAAPMNTPAGTFGYGDRTGKPSTGPMLVQLQIPAGFLNAYSPVQQFNGVPYLISLTVTSAKETIKAYRKILINNQLPNQNPVLGDVLADGVSLSALPPKEVKLTVQTTSMPESYQIMMSDGSIHPQSEEYGVQWFISDGELPISTAQWGEPTTWKPPTAKPAARPNVVVGVLRDNRGGESVLVKKF